MSDPDPDKIELTPTTPPPIRIVEKSILLSSRFPFMISLLSVAGIIFIYSSQNILKVGSSFALNDKDYAFIRFILPNALYVLLTAVAIFSAYIGYRLTVAAGATRNPVIPAEDYALLSPLVKDGKTEAIDQYVRLSSLVKFTGTFTQLGLTGLPLATIFLTIFFSFLAIISGDSFLDLTKLTLGAFIGSFVQRQVERKAVAADENSAEGYARGVRRQS